eukprot:1161421-Pelagomonas_calceolata.AAC.1
MLAAALGWSLEYRGGLAGDAFAHTPATFEASSEELAVPPPQSPLTHAGQDYDWEDGMSSERSSALWRLGDLATLQVCGAQGCRVASLRLSRAAVCTGAALFPSGREKYLWPCRFAGKGDGIVAGLPERFAGKGIRQGRSFQLGRLVRLSKRAPPFGVYAPGWPAASACIVMRLLCVVALLLRQSSTWSELVIRQGAAARDTLGSFAILVYISYKEAFAISELMVS